MIRKLLFGIFVTGLLVLGLLAQAGAYLLGLPSPAASPSGSASDASLPFEEPGPHDVGIRRLTLDQAPIAMTLWYPAAAESAEPSLAYSYGINMFGPGSSVALATYRGRAVPAAAFDLSAAPYPLVVLSHGFAITGSSYAWLAEQLASHGLVVVAPQHRETLDPGGLWRSTIERPKDILTVFSHIDTEVQEGGELEGLVDSETVAVVGHSYGGYTALAAAGARLDMGALQNACDGAYESDGALVFLCDALLPRVDEMAGLAGLDTAPSGLWPAMADRRVDAIVSIAGDAAMFGRTGLAGITVPTMAIGGTADVDSPFEWGTELTYEHVSSSGKVEMAFQDAAHMIFAGECERVRRIMSLVSLGFCSDPAWDRDRAHRLVRRYVTAFVLAELMQDQRAMATLAPRGQGLADFSYRAEGY